MAETSLRGDRGRDAKPQVRDLQTGLQKPQEDTAGRRRPGRTARARNGLRGGDMDYNQRQAADSPKHIPGGRICWVCALLGPEPRGTPGAQLPAAPASVGTGGPCAQHKSTT